MATHDYIISNASGAAVRADLNNALAAIATNNSSATEPTTTYAYQWWADTGSSPTVMKLRNAANSGWITLFQLDGEWTVVPFENGTAAAPSIYFKDSGTDTGIYSPGTDQVAITTGGTGRLFVTSSGSVGIGTSSPSVLTHLSTSTDTQLRVESTSASSTNEAALQLIRGSNQSAIKNKAGGIEFFVQGLTNEIARFDSSGRLGIGTTSPNSVLQVNSGTNLGGILVGFNSGSSNFYDADLQVFRTGNGTERARIDSSGRLLVGTSSARTNIREGTDNETPKIQFESATNDYSEAGLSIVNNSSSGFAPQLWLGRSASDSIGGNALVSSGRIGSISFNAADGTNFIQGARIQADIDGTSGSGDLPTRLSFSVTADGASSPSTAMTINQNRTLTSEADIFVKGGLFVSDPITTNRYLYKASSGGGTATVYIGNAAIQVSSDARLKDNIQDTSLSAVEELQKVRVVDFTWNDPSDTSYNNRNARGTWTGVIAQELVDVFPFAVNAPRKEDDLSIDYDSDSTWTVEQQQLVPVLIKAIQEQQAVITDLQDRLSALEAK